MDVATLYSLPLELLSALAAGYVGYRIFASGTDRLHKTHDAIFQTFVFSVPPHVTASWLLANTQLGNVWVVFWATLVALVFAILVRFLLPLLKKIPAAIHLSNENYWPSTWAAMIYEPRFAISRIDVLLENGEWLESDLTKVPDESAHYPLDWDYDGNIAMYVTGKVDVKGTRDEYDRDDISSEYWGSIITYVPAAKIQRVQIAKVPRRKK